MAERVNRRELIIDTASTLFRKHGYTQTSVRQIAEEVGVTEAALYYHFKDGKRELLSEVFECEMPDLVALLDDCDDADSLDEFIHKFGETMAETMPARLDTVRWIISEFNKMDDAEKALFHEKQIRFHNRMTEIIGRFVDDEAQAYRTAWLIILTSFGYGLFFVNMEMDKIAEFSIDDMLDTLSQALTGTLKP